MSFINYPTKDLNKYIKDNYNNEEKIREYQKTKDIDLRNEIVLQNMRLVINIAEEYQFPTKTPLGDLISVGTIALINAVENYEEKDNKFSTFATTCILNAISAEVNYSYGEGSKYYGDIIKKYRAIAISIFGENDIIFKEDTIDYVLEIMKEKKFIREGAIPEIKSRLLSSSLYDMEYNDDNEIEFKVKEEALNVAYDDESDFDRTEFIKENKDRLYSGLSDYEKEVMDYYCGFKDGIAHKQKEIANIYGISHQAIQQQYSRAITKMKLKADRYL